MGHRLTDIAVRIAGPQALAAAAETVYTVPADTQAIVRGMHFANHDTVTRQVTLAFAGADGIATKWLPAFSIDPNATYDWSGFAVLEDGEILQAYADVADKVTLTHISAVETSSAIAQRVFMLPGQAFFTNWAGDGNQAAPLGVLPVAATLKRVRYLSEEDIAADNSDYWNIELRHRDETGVDQGDYGTVTTENVGAGGVGDVDQYVPFGPAASDRTCAAGDNFYLHIFQTGSPPSVNRWSATLEFEVL